MSEDRNASQGPQTPRERTPIFTEMQLKNFKSIRDAVIPLHPLTVIVGANSSGKSTALQALLVLAQAARAEIGSDRLPLNGEYVQLGEFQEVQTFGVEPGTGISFGLSAEVLSERPRMRALRSLPGDQRATLTWAGHFAQPADPRSGFALLNAMEMALTAITGGPIFNLDIASVREETAEQDEVRHEDPLAMMKGPLLKVDGRATRHHPIETLPVQRARFKGGVPERLYGEVSRLTLCARTWWETWERANEEELLELREHHRRGVGSFQKSPSSQSRLAAVKLAAELIKASEFVYDLFSQIGHDFEGPRDVTLNLQSYFAEDLATHSPAARKKILISMTILREKGFVDELTNQIGAPQWLDQYSSQEMRGRLGDTIRDASSYFRGYLRTLRYLGPIREAPRAIYDPSPNRNDIGVRGEYAAAVLHARAREIVTCPMAEGGFQRIPLGEALNLWLSEFGLATRVEAKDLGRLGMSLTVAPTGGSRLIDLTSVGVGVSQVLPVILLCLLSRSTSVILLEQPELHLHPAMQLKLADFLLACSESGQQIIVETHSEHLVNRLRRRVANDSTKTLSRSIGLLFAEQKNGVSQYRATAISESGGLSQGWPEGFLDVGSNEASEFISEALRRRRQSTEASKPGKK
jgi:predicted ATPase